MNKRLIFVASVVLIIAIGLGRWRQNKQVAPKQLTEQSVLEQINSYRTGKKMAAVLRSEKLDRASLSRLEAIKNNQDFSGEKTGLTLENAVHNNGYSFGLVGDLYLENVDGETNLIAEWQKNDDAKKTLDEKGFRDIGIAIEENRTGYRVVVILARPMTVKAAPETGAGGYPSVSWGGPELWAAVNKRRIELGVNPLKQLDILCTIASIRLNQLLELGKLDGHAGFEPTLSRPDLAWVKQKYNISEFLILGYQTPEEAVAAWEHTLGHRALLAGGEYVWGCVYAQNTFGVAITAY